MLQAIAVLDRPCDNPMVEKRPAVDTSSQVKQNVTSTARQLLQRRQELQSHRQEKDRERLIFPEPPDGLHGSLAAGT